MRQQTRKTVAILDIILILSTHFRQALFVRDSTDDTSAPIAKAEVGKKQSGDAVGNTTDIASMVAAKQALAEITNSKDEKEANSGHVGDAIAKTNETNFVDSEQAQHVSATKKGPSSYAVAKGAYGLLALEYRLGSWKDLLDSVESFLGAAGRAADKPSILLVGGTKATEAAAGVMNFIGVMGVAGNAITVAKAFHRQYTPDLNPVWKQYNSMTICVCSALAFAGAAAVGFSLAPLGAAAGVGGVLWELYAFYMEEVVLLNEPEILSRHAAETVVREVPTKASRFAKMKEQDEREGTDEVGDVEEDGMIIAESALGAEKNVGIWRGVAAAILEDQQRTSREELFEDGREPDFRLRDYQ